MLPMEGGASLPSMTHIANQEMAKHWDGEEGDDWTDNAERYDATDRYVWRQFVSKVPVGESERVLDVGCGTGKSTRRWRARHEPAGCWGSTFRHGCWSTPGADPTTRA